MKSINEIMKDTECTKEQAEKLYEDLTKLPEKLGEFISNNLDRVNAFNANEIEVTRLYGYSRDAANVIVKRQRTDNFPTYLDDTPRYHYWKYCFDCLIDYVGEEYIC